jgi:lipoprotein signal peptidase
VSPSNHPVRRLTRKLLGHRRTTLRAGAPRGRRAADHQPMRGWRPALLIGAVVALLDWTVKFLVASNLALEDFRQVVPGRVALWHVRNDAMMLGLWGDLPLAARQAIAVVAALVGAVVLLQILGRGHRFPRPQQRWTWLFVGLVLGGMLGNLGERAVHWGVTDYLSIRWGEYWLPPGNVADLALFASFFLALPIIAFELMGRARRGKALPAIPVEGSAPGAASGA